MMNIFVLTINAIFPKDNNSYTIYNRQYIERMIDNVYRIVKQCAMNTHTGVKLVVL